MRASRGDVLVRAGILLAFLAVVAVAVVVGDHGSGGTAATAGEPA